MDTPTSDQLAIAQRLLDWTPGSFACRPLSGGLNNRSFELSRGTERYLLRIRPRVAGAALLAADLEIQLLRTVAASGIGPAVRAGDAAAGLLISEFLATARPWRAGAAPSTLQIERLAQLLRRVHAVAFDLPSFDASAVSSRYLDAMTPPADAPAEQSSWQQELRELARWYGGRFEAATVCHNDLVPDNILDDGDRLWLIDFEYAAHAHPILDLANCAAMNALNESARRRLCAAYYGGERAPFGTRDLARVVRMQQLLAYFWVLWSSRVAPAERSWEVHRAAWADVLRQGEK